jgi:hypothetical protein
MVKKNQSHKKERSFFFGILTITHRLGRREFSKGLLHER